MPRRADLESVLVLGAGSVVAGRGAGFDCFGTRAARVLRAEGLRVVLVDSDPATVMTDPGLADATYLEPVTPETVEQVIAKERPDALLPTLGGRTALNTAIALHESGVLAYFGVELIGVGAVRAGEDRQELKRVVEAVGGAMPRGVVCQTSEQTSEQCLAAAAELGYPVVVRPTGNGVAVAHDEPELRAALTAASGHEVFLEESVLGWKEYELELVRDRDDTVIVVCSIENVDPMGVHTGDSITVAPALTLTARERRRMRDTAVAVIRGAGVDSGGCSVRFAVDPRTGRMLVVGMDPRVSRSSALASKATGFPTAAITARLAVGYTLDEIRDDATGRPWSGFEPVLDHVVVKAPRFAFEQFPAADPTLTTRMKSVGEAMAVGRSFPEALGKALRSLESPDSLFSWAGPVGDKDALVAACAVPVPGRIALIHQAVRAGATVAELTGVTGIDPWFLEQIERIEQVARVVAGQPGAIEPDTLLSAKRHGLSDAQVGQLRGLREESVREVRWALGVRPGYQSIDSSRGACLYSSYDQPTELAVGSTPKAVILGSGPNRIGQGAEFDHSCVQASFALRDADYETVMVDCNPEAVSTDHDTSHRLYFEPRTVEDVLEVVAAEQAVGPVAGVLVQLGGRTPPGLAAGLAAVGAPVVGTPADSVDLAEDRDAFGALVAGLGLAVPARGSAASHLDAKRIAEEIGYPVIIRPGVEIVHDGVALAGCLERAATAFPGQAVLVDRFLGGAVEVDVDALYDGVELYLGGVMEHIEAAGARSGDSACVLPPLSLGRADLARVREATRALAAELHIRGLINVRYALAGGVLYVLGANPGASRTVPFVSKATGTPLAKAAARIMVGAGIAGLRGEELLRATGDGATATQDTAITVKMRSTGGVMGIDTVFGAAYAKSQAAVHGRLPPRKGRVLASIADRDKRAMVFPLKALADAGFEILATAGTAEVLRRNGIRAAVVRRSRDGAGSDNEPTAAGRIWAGEIDLVVDTASGTADKHDDSRDSRDSRDSGIRAAATACGIPCVTTVQALAAFVLGIDAMNRGDIGISSVQEHAWVGR